MLLLTAILYICPPSTERYKEKIAVIESSDNYCADNGDHYGKYQFSMTTIYGLIRLGYLDLPCEGLTIDNFLNDSIYQERAMNAHIEHQWDIMKKMNLFKYKGRTIRGVKITVERLFAGMHFVGPTSLKHFLKTGSLKSQGKFIKKDRYGTTLTQYMKRIC